MVSPFVDLEPVKVVDEPSPIPVLINSVINAKNETRIGESDSNLLYNYNWSCDHERTESDLDSTKTP
jgi:hypothetical protein